jgi:HD domain.
VVLPRHKNNWSAILERLLVEVENTGYWGYLDHASTVAGVALDVLDALQDKYRFTAQDRLNTYVAALLHDIGRVWGREEDHHIIGAEYVKKADFLRDKVDLDIVSKTILYHRRKTRITEDQELASMGVKALVIAAMVRLADSFKNAYKGEGIYLGTEMANDKLVVKINGYMHEEVDFDRFYEKAEALEEVTKIKVEAVEEF